MDAVAGLDALPPSLRIEAARLLAAGGDVVPFARSTKAVTIAAGAKLTMPAINRGMIKELGLRQPRIALAAINAGTGLELPNIDAILLLALVDKGREGALASASNVIKAEAGDVVVGGKTLSNAEIGALLKDKLAAFDGPRLAKLAEIGIIGVEA